MKRGEKENMKECLKHNWVFVKEENSQGLTLTCVVFVCPDCEKVKKIDV